MTPQEIKIKTLISGQVDMGTYGLVELELRDLVENCEKVNLVDIKTKIEEILAKYWYETEYVHIDKQDIKKCEKSRSKFNEWVNNNLDSFCNKTTN